MGESRRDHYRTPSVGDDTARVVEAAIGSLAQLRGFGHLDATARLHLLASVVAETQRAVRAAVSEARCQHCSWAQIGDLVGVTRSSAQQRYGSRIGGDRLLSAPD